MPDLDQLFKTAGAGLDAYANAQVWEARVVRVTDEGPFVIVPRYDPHLRWGPCLVADAPTPDVRLREGDRVAIAMSNEGRPWVVADGAGALERYVREQLDPLRQRITALEARAHSH